MTEKTINEAELKEVLSTLSLLNTIVGHAIQQKAFPPIFKPKEGEIVIVSNLVDFSGLIFLEFSHMNKLDGYVCNYQGSLREFLYAKPQTPTQKGE